MIGYGNDHLAEPFRRFAMAFLRFERFAKRIEQIRMVWHQLQRPSQRILRLGPAFQGIEGDRPVGVRLRGIGIERRGLGECRFGVGVTLAFVQHTTEIGVVGRGLWALFDRLLDRRDRGVGTAGLIVEQAQHVQRVRVVWLRGKNLPVQRLCRRHVARLVTLHGLGEPVPVSGASLSTGRASAFRSVHALSWLSAAVTPRPSGNGY